MSIQTLFSLLGFPTLPKKGEEKFYHDNTTFNQNLKVTGDFIAQRNSLTLGEKGICGNLYMLKNPFDRKPVIPNIFGTGGIIAGFSGIYLYGSNSYVSGIFSITGTTNLFGKINVNGKDLETELALGKALPSPSDERLKKNIRTIENSLEKVSALRGVTFDFKENNKKQIGVIAQEVEKIIPEVVQERPDGYKGVQYENLVALLIEAVKEQQNQINELREKLNEQVN
jgi:hypothetical protein